jgi:hypothetical protein
VAAPVAGLLHRPAGPIVIVYVTGGQAVRCRATQTGQT